MELRHIRYFVAVATELNITRAAAQLHISQPALSRQIKDLEGELGTQLFERTGNTVMLSTTGKTFLHESRMILKRVDDAVAKVSNTTSQQLTKVRLGYPASPTKEILAKALEHFHRVHPGMTVELYDLSSNGLVRALKEGKIDIALGVAIAPNDFAGFAVEEVAVYEVRVAFHRQHRFSKMRFVPIQDVANEKIITFTRDEHPEVLPGLLKIFGHHNEDPNIVMECDGVMSLLAAVEAKKGVALVFQTVSRIAGSSVLLRPIRPAPPLLPIAMAYRKNTLPLSVAALVSSLRDSKQKSTKSKGPLLRV